MSVRKGELLKSTISRRWPNHFSLNNIYQCNKLAVSTIVTHNFLDTSRSLRAARWRCETLSWRWTGWWVELSACLPSDDLVPTIGRTASEWCQAEVRWGSEGEEEEILKVTRTSTRLSLIILFSSCWSDWLELWWILYSFKLLSEWLWSVKSIVFTMD